MASIFDSKYFNPEVFGQYLETVPRVKQNALIKAGVLRSRTDLKTMLSEQTGGNYISVPMTGLIGGDVLNYDGNTDITATGIDTFLQSMIVVGRAKAWQEKDFSQDITGKDFMEDIAAQVAQYWDDVDQATLIAILTGIFAMSDGSGFADAHTLDITTEDDGTVNATTLNTAVQKAAGANKNIFTLAIMHSQVATTLENLQLLSYFQGTDANGLTRDMSLATWNGRTVLIDDDVPVDAETGAYTTYLLGQNAFDYCDCGAKVPNETWRDPATSGGLDWLITRQRHLYAPRGISYLNTDSVISPTDTQLENGTNWEVVKNTAEDEYFNIQSIPIARIISLG